MTETLKITDLECHCYRHSGSTRIIYMIYPPVNGFSDQWIQQQAEKFACSIAIVYVPLNKWNDYLTPWPEHGETPKAPPFGGEASAFLDTLQHEVIPQVEKALGLTPPSERSLTGVSLAGLFTLWQWMQCDTFHSIAYLSGSFWYAGFIHWFKSLTLPRKQGKAYFLLGTREPESRIKAFRTVGTNTELIVSALKSAGIDTTFDWVPGNHFSNPLPRATKALSHLT